MKPNQWITENKQVFTERDLRFLLKHSLGKDVFELEAIGKAYVQGMPLAYILGKEEFFGYEFDITSDVLIPRPETELIVEKAIELIKGENLNSVLDLCCGSGNIAISIAKELSKEVVVSASDCSAAALKIAKLNAKKHKVNVNFSKVDLLAGFKQNSFDLIVSNPPYVEDEAIGGTLKYEPHAALSGGSDGLDVIRRILEQAKSHLKKDGYIIIEIGYNHKERLKEYIDNLGFYRIEGWIKDYSGHWRGVIVQCSGR